MDLLLDTHVLLWVLSDPSKIAPWVQQELVVETNNVFVSIVSLWEIVVKWRIGKLDLELKDLFAVVYAPDSKMQVIDITAAHLFTISTLPRTPNTTIRSIIC